MRSSVVDGVGRGNQEQRPLAGREVAGDLLPLLWAGLTLLDCRELCEAASAMKVSRLVVPVPAVEDVLRWAATRGLAGAAAEGCIGRTAVEEGRGAWFNVGQPAPQSRLAHRLVYVASTVADRDEAQDADRREDHRTLGDLLGIPECCIDFYEYHRRQAVHRWLDDYAPLIHARTLAAPAHPPLANYLGQYFGQSYIHHYPCTWSCLASRERGAASRRIVASSSPEWARTFDLGVAGLFVVEGRRAIHHVRAANDAEVDNTHIRPTPDATRSTSSTPLGQRLRAARQIRWSDDGRCAVDGVELGGSDDETFAVPFAWEAS